MFQTDRLRPEDHTDLSGFFQFLDSFADAEARLRHEFRFLLAIEDRAGRIVAVMVWRSDYLARDGFRFRVLGAAIVEHAGTLVALGSDDLDWCQAHLGLNADRTRFISQDCTRTVLTISSLCDHHVILTSTFSGWDACLAGRPVGRVLPPDPWYAEPAFEVCFPPNATPPAGSPSRPTVATSPQRRSPRRGGASRPGGDAVRNQRSQGLTQRWEAT